MSYAESLLKNRKFLIPMATILLLLITDQWIKTYIKGHFMLGEIKPIRNVVTALARSSADILVNLADSMKV